MNNFVQVTPFMHCRDLSAALGFFHSLGFSTLFRLGDYAYVEREGCGIRILEGGDLPPAHGGFAYYIDVLDVDRLHAELRPVLDEMPSKHVHGPVDQTYGQRELMIRAPDGNLLVFGQAIGG